MPPTDWNQLLTHEQWAQQLHELLVDTQRALAQPTTAQRAAATKAAIAALQSYIDHEPGFIDDLLGIARSAIIDAALADIGDALAQLGDLQRQLQQQLQGHLAARFTPPGAEPRQQLLQALGALTALRAQHQQLPYAHPTLASDALSEQLRQFSQLLAELLPGATRPPAAKPPGARRRSAR